MLEKRKINCDLCVIGGGFAGIAAAIVSKENCTPHEVYLNHIKEFQTKLLNEDCFLPSFKREISEVCKNAEFSGPDILRNGEAYHSMRCNQRLDSPQMSLLKPFARALRF